MVFTSICLAIVLGNLITLVKSTQYNGTTLLPYLEIPEEKTEI